MTSSAMKADRVSVIVPVFNGATTLARALDSLLRQSYQDWEAIVVDDGSQDDTPRIIENYRTRDPRIIGIRQQRKGRGGARNAGLEQRRGAYVTFLDADDEYDPRKIERQVATLIQNPHADAVVCGFRRINEAGRVYYTKKYNSSKAIDKYSFFVGLPSFIPSTMFRSTKVGDVRFIENAYAEDWDFCLRLAWQGCRFVTMSGVLWTYYEGRSAWEKTTEAYCNQQMAVVARNFHLLAREEERRWFARAAMARVAAKMLSRAIAVQRPHAAQGAFDFLNGNTFKSDERILISLGFGKQLYLWHRNFGRSGCHDLKRALNHIPPSLSKPMIVIGALAAQQPLSLQTKREGRLLIAASLVLASKMLFKAVETVIVQTILKRNTGRNRLFRIASMAFAMNRRSGDVFPAYGR